MFFFFKQKTAYEMRISDWSSDVCSSDLTLTSVTGYSLNDFRSIDDANATFQGLAQLATGRSDVGAISYFSVNSRKFSQELRLVSPSDRPLEWLIGAFYTNEKNKPFYKDRKSTRLNSSHYSAYHMPA